MLLNLLAVLTVICCSSPTDGLGQLVAVGVGACSNSSDCYPAGLNGSSVPTKYINCSNQKCVCSDCFYAANSFKSCAYQRCWGYDNTTQTCNDLRKSQKTALLLSTFLSSLGAANYYIDQATLGQAQLVLFVYFWFSFILIIVSICCLIKTEDCVLCPLCSMLCGSLAALLVVSVMLCWWAVDLIYFSSNARPDGNGCPLLYDL